VLEETLKIVQELIDADWVTIFVHDEKADTLLPRAHRRGKATFLAPRVPPELIDDTNVRAAFEIESLVKVVEGDRLQAAIPAFTGGDKLGVVAVSAPLSGTPEEKAQRVEMFESALKDIAEHIAYALRAMTFQARALIDELTGLGNRRLFDERLSEMAALALRKNQPLSLVLVDVDHFKRVNDTYGHQMGDRVLREVAGVLSKGLRRYDSAYRYGGEEMAILLPQTELADAARLAERIRARIGKRAFGSKQLKVTASFGIAALGTDVLTIEALVAAADAQVYRAKAAGRNRVEPAELLEVGGQ
jgi:diguanylate cyclase (GGDEF)-like protein